MSEKAKKNLNNSRRAARTRALLHGTSERPRLTVTISNRHISAQVINDDLGSTLVAATTTGLKIDNLTMTEKAIKIGESIATQAKKKNITKVVFDRGAKRYHGRIKALADTARENGLEF